MAVHDIGVALHNAGIIFHQLKIKSITISTVCQSQGCCKKKNNPKNPPGFFFKAYLKQYNKIKQPKTFFNFSLKNRLSKK